MDEVVVHLLCTSHRRIPESVSQVNPSLTPVSALSLTTAQARLFAEELRLHHGGGGIGAVGAALLDARVDLNPHQIEAALFGLQARVDEGRILADEVGLGKTIEASLVLSQRWAERRRRLLVIVPATLRRQWSAELEDKFGLPTRIVDGKERGLGAFNGRAVHICSYHLAAREAEVLRQIPWDLIVIDEAHRLRSAGASVDGGVRKGVAGRVAEAVSGSPRVLLTATPMQNSLVELHTLVEVAHPGFFGPVHDFKARFLKAPPDWEGLRERLAEVCLRTLRRDVLPYIQYTARHALTVRFRGTDAERALHDAVLAFLRREELHAVAKQQRALVRTLLHKLLASSPAAIASALRKFARHLDDAATDVAAEPLEEAFQDEGFDPEWSSLGAGPGPVEAPPPAPHLPALPPSADGGVWTRADEQAEFDRLITMADAISEDARAHALLRALASAFSLAGTDGDRPRKAVVFTESRRTQARLKDFLARHGFAGKVVTFSGDLASGEAKALLAEWQTANPERSRTATSAVNLRAAVVEHFQRAAEVLISTEAGSEGLNLQFCSVVVNYDLPWNPQRVEQRIGRCHRYGQRHDVVVVNFLDETNHTELRVLDLLGGKFGLFEGVLGASDSVLGAMEDGVDLEKRIHGIIRECRSKAEIDVAFNALRRELDAVIKAREKKAQSALFEHFDEAVHERLRGQLGAARGLLDRTTQRFWRLMRFGLGGRANFDSARLAFELSRDDPETGAPAGRYVMVGHEAAGQDSHVLRMSHPLGEHVVDSVFAATVDSELELELDLTRHPVRVSQLDGLRGRRGWLSLSRVSVTSIERREQLVLSGLTDDGEELDHERVDRMLALAGAAGARRAPPVGDVAGRLEAVIGHATGAALRALSEQNDAEFRERAARIERLRDDRVRAAENEEAALKAELRAAERRQSNALTLDERRTIGLELEDIDGRLRRARARVQTVWDDASAERRALMTELERLMVADARVERVFTVPWHVT
jgi:hypothetical protein